MNSFFRYFTALLFALAFFPTVATSQSEEVRDKYVVAQLISNQSAIAPGEPFTLGLKFTIDPTWHTYWINPGPAGMPTEVQLDLPEGFTSGPLQFPVPKRFVTDYGSDIIEAGFGYEDSVIHPVTITPPSDLATGDPITITANATWLMCDPSSCVPGKATLTITLPVAEEAAKSDDDTIIAFYEEKLPKNTDWPLSFDLTNGKATITLEVPAEELPENAELHLHPYKNFIFDQLSVPEVTRESDSVTFVFDSNKHLTAVPETFEALLVAETETGKTGFRVTYGETEVPTVTEEVVADQVEPVAASEPESLPFGGGFLGILLAAFLGGMILNIMPCVFPVISLKVLSFVGQAGEDRKKVFAHSLMFTLGVLIFFWILTAALLIVRATAGEVGWGEQLQQPAFVIGLIFVMILVALNLFGVFEVGTSLTGVGGDLTNKSGYSGSFWSGALAVLLATPCTAPLMAPAITFALSQSAPVTILVFTSLGLGMAAPYFLFAAFPKLLDILPAPGAWMETFKQFMGFPMLAVAVWLTGVLSKQLSVSGLQWSLAAVVLLAMAGWVLGRYTGFDRQPSVRLKGRIAALLVFLASLGLAWDSSKKRAPASSIDIVDVIKSKQAEGKNVFVDFTAEWCVTCKVNERTTIKTEKVKTAFEENNVELVIADWTNQDPAITRLLKEHGRAGVPFYVLYPSDSSASPITLPDGLVTFGHIEEAIAQLP